MPGRNTSARTLLSAASLILISILLVAQALAAPEPRGPGDISHEIAEAKARFYARIPIFESTPTPNPHHPESINSTLLRLQPASTLQLPQHRLQP